MKPGCVHLLTNRPGGMRCIGVGRDPTGAWNSFANGWFPGSRGVTVTTATVTVITEGPSAARRSPAFAGVQGVWING